MTIKLKRINIEIASIAIFMTLWIMSLLDVTFVYRKAPILMNFKDRIVSNATASGYDVAKRINTTYLYIFGLIIVFLTFYILLSRVLEVGKYEVVDNTIILCQELSIFGIAIAICGYIVGNIDITIGYMGLLIILILIIWRVARVTNRNINVHVIEWGIGLTFSITIFLRTLIDIDIPIYVFVIISFLMCMLLVSKLQDIFKHKTTVEEINVIIVKSTFPIFITAFIQSVLLELLNILNRRGIWACNNPKIVYVIVMVIAVLLSMRNIINNVNKKSDKELTVKNILEKKWYVFFIITVFMIIVQPNKQIGTWGEYFETANHGLALDALFRYGQIPIIENFDAHMLYNQIMGIIYYIFNGYEPWAFNLYSGYILIPINLLVYSLIGKIYGKRNALIFTVTFPFVSTLFPHFTIITLVVLSLYKLLEDKDFRNPIWVWICIAICTLLTLDMGVAAAGAGIITFLFIMTIKREKGIKDYLEFFGKGVFLLVSGIVVFSVLCLIKSIHPLKRIIEFISIALSNQNWAYSTVGDETTLAFALSYYIAPIILMILLGIVVYKAFILRNYNITNIYATIGFVYFSIAYLITIPRGIVRHSLAEGRMVLILSYFPVAILCFVAIWAKSKKIKVYQLTISSILMVILMNINLTQFPLRLSAISQLIESIDDQNEYETFLDLSEGRVSGDILNNEEVKSFKIILDTILNENQTYLDMTSLNYYYALVAREKPVYVNQSPLLLNGETTQGYFLEQIKNSDVPVAIVPINESSWAYIDGINVMDKYYLLSEYIYQNYVPLCRLSGFDIWVIGDKKKDFTDKIEALLSSETIYSLNLEDPRENLIQGNNVNTTVENNEIVMESVGEDTFIYTSIDNINMPEKENVYDISLNVTPNQDGFVQVFYTRGQEDYNEESSETFEVFGETNNIIKLMLNQLPENIRIDIDDIKSMQIHSLDIRIANVNITMIDEQQVINNLPINHNQGLVPWYWANYDESKNIKVVEDITPLIKKEDNIYQVDLESSLRQSINYANIAISSPREQDISMVFRDKNNAINPTTYIFKVKEGVYNYRVRISSNYGYYINKYNLLTLEGNEELVELVDIRMEHEDIMSNE